MTPFPAQQLLDAFESAIPKEPDELSDLEKIAVLWVGGVEMETEMNGDKFTMKTKYLAGIAKANGRFIVAQSSIK
jgi:hypothetical protein